MEEIDLNKNVYTPLKELGLTDLEINLYTISLALGPSTVSTIAKHLKISRPNVYKIIRGLENHGLVKFSEKKFARRFVVESPTIILEKLREKKDKISQLDNYFVANLPDLLNMYHQGSALTKIKVLQGKDQYLKLFNQSLDEEKKEIQYFGSAEDFIKFISWKNENKWIKKRIRKNILIKILVLPSSTADALKLKDKQELRETKILNNTKAFSSSFQLFANKVIVWQPQVPLAILIEDEYVVEMFRSIFATLWEQY